jgi:hypothetical protein
MGPLLEPMLETVVDKLSEANDVVLDNLHQWENGADPLELYTKFYVTKLKAQQAKDDPFADHIDRLDLDNL